MFRTILQHVARLAHTLRQRLWKSVRASAPEPLSPAQQRLQRRLEKSRQRTRAARKKGRKVAHQKSTLFRQGTLETTLPAGALLLLYSQDLRKGKTRAMSLLVEVQDGTSLLAQSGGYFIYFSGTNLKVLAQQRYDARTGNDLPAQSPAPELLPAFTKGDLFGIYEYLFTHRDRHHIALVTLPGGSTFGPVEPATASRKKRPHTV